MRVVIAPDSFKGSASAADAAQALRGGWLSVRPGDVVQLLPMADGGEGTLDAFLIAIPGAQRIPITVTGLTGAPVETSWVLLPPTASTSDMTGLAPLPPGGARILSDVTNPLLGPTGAAAVFAPQKGASSAQVAELERALTHVADLMQVDPQTAGSGAAGGTGFGLLAWGAEMASGRKPLARRLECPKRFPTPTR